MNNMRFKCYKISERITFPDSFSKDAEWRNYVRIDNSGVEKILKYGCKAKEIYVFRFGCVSFVNFSEDEIKTATSYIKSTFYVRDYADSYENIESIGVVFGETDTGYNPEFCYEQKYKKAFLKLAPLMMAKSVELNNLENELSSLIDDTEVIIRLTARKKHRLFNKRLTSAVTRILKFNYDVIINESAFDDSRISFNPTYSKISCDLTEYFELEDRQRIFMIKLDNAKGLIKRYRESSYEVYMLAFEQIQILLLVFFPFAYILSKNPEYFNFVYHGIRDILEFVTGK